MIALDAHGADGGLAVVVEGAREAGPPVRLYGPREELARTGAADFAEIEDCPVAIEPDEEPARAARVREDASVVRAAAAVAAGNADALVSAGPTGAVLAASVLRLRRMRGVHRPAIAVVLPVPGGRTLLLDAGANVEVRPEHLVQFAYLGATFMEAVHGVRHPSVGLLSVGEEPGKGTPDVVEAHRRIAEGPLRFVGNVEGHDLASGKVDVVVTDGFTGNVALKTLEGAARAVGGAVSEALRSGPLSALGGLLARRRLGEVRSRLDPNEVGGAILLGVAGVVVIAHGGSSARGIAQAVRVARRAVDERMVERTATALAAAGALRSAPAASVAVQS